MSETPWISPSGLHFTDPQWEAVMSALHRSIVWGNELAAAAYLRGAADTLAAIEGEPDDDAATG